MVVGKKDQKLPGKYHLKFPVSGVLLQKELILYILRLRNQSKRRENGLTHATRESSESASKRGSSTRASVR